MSKTVLVIDDAKQLRTMVDAYLTQEGFRVVSAANGQEGLFVARQEKPDLVLLDLMMPEMGGYDFLRAYNREADTPVIILTAKLEEHDKVLGLELGADDYVTKPFSPRELTARVRAVLRRTQREDASNENKILHVANIMLDRTTRRVTIGESGTGENESRQEVELTPSEFDLLAIFMASPGRVFSRLDLLDRMQGDAYEGYERTIDVHIRNLRAKIEPNTRKPRYIETVYGVGYRFSE